MKQHLTALIHRSQGQFNRDLLAKAMEKLTEEEQRALYHLLQEKDRQMSVAKRVRVKFYGS